MKNNNPFGFGVDFKGNIGFGFKFPNSPFNFYNFINISENNDDNDPLKKIKKTNSYLNNHDNKNDE